jgi:hypothetical protein
MSVSVPVIDYIDTSTRRIYLLAGVTEYHPLDDIYKEVRNLRRTDESLRGFFTYVQGGGNIPKNVSGTLRTPRYAIFKNCKVVVSGDTYVTGEQLYADADGNMIGKGPDCVDHVLSPTDAYLDYEPPGSEVIVGAGGLTSEQEAKLSAAATEGTLVRKILVNRQEFQPDGDLVTYDDDDATIIDHQKIYVKSGSKYVPPDDVPYRRMASSPPD